MVSGISESARAKIEEWVNNAKEAIMCAQETALSARQTAEKFQIEAREAIVKAEEISKASREAADETMRISREAAEASKRAAREAGECWIRVFRELISDSGEASARAREIVQQTTEFLQKTPQEIVIESAGNDKALVEMPGESSGALEADDSEAGEGQEKADSKSKGNKTESKNNNKELKEKAKNRLDSLTKMFLSSTEGESEEAD
jgi:hypothetical protein